MSGKNAKSDELPEIRTKTDLSDKLREGAVLVIPQGEILNRINSEKNYGYKGFLVYVRGLDTLTNAYYVDILRKV